ncbi:Protein of unknown function [Gryllus bimaculatus]|nr:Protein of unknown function [Gryllus bimaculatus]
MPSEGGCGSGVAHTPQRKKKRQLRGEGCLSIAELALAASGGAGALRRRTSLGADRHSALCARWMGLCPAMLPVTAEHVWFDIGFYPIQRGRNLDQTLKSNNNNNNNNNNK